MLLAVVVGDLVVFVVVVAVVVDARFVFVVAAVSLLLYISSCYLAHCSWATNQFM